MPDWSRHVHRHLSGRARHEKRYPTELHSFDIRCDEEEAWGFPPTGRNSPQIIVVLLDLLFYWIVVLSHNCCSIIVGHTDLFRLPSRVRNGAMLTYFMRIRNSQAEAYAFFPWPRLLPAFLPPAHFRLLPIYYLLAAHAVAGIKPSPSYRPAFSMLHRKRATSLSRNRLCKSKATA